MVAEVCPKYSLTVEPLKIYLISNAASSVAFINMATRFMSQRINIHITFVIKKKNVSTKLNLFSFDRQG